MPDVQALKRLVHDNVYYDILTAPLAPLAEAQRALVGGGASPWRSAPNPWSTGCWPLGHGTKNPWNAARARASAQPSPGHGPKTAATTHVWHARVSSAMGGTPGTTRAQPVGASTSRQGR